LAAVVVGLAAAVAILSYQFDFTAINRGEASDYSFTIGEKYGYLQRSYGFFSLVIMLVGGAVVTKNYWGATSTSKKRLNLLWLLAGLSVTAMMFSNFPYVMKFLTWGRFCWDLFFYTAVCYCLGKIPARKWRYLGAGLVWVAAVVIFVFNTSEWKTYFNYHQELVQASEQEVAAAEWLRTHYGQLQASEVLLISDPATMHILEGLGGVNTAAGNYTSVANRELIAGSYYETYVGAAYQKLAQVQDELVTSEGAVKLLAVSGRTMNWLGKVLKQELPFTYNVWVPKDFNGYDQFYLHNLANFGSFEEVYNDGYLVIYELNSAAVTTVEVKTNYVEVIEVDEAGEEIGRQREVESREYIEYDVLGREVGRRVEVTTPAAELMPVPE
jgi:hypothetical protein